MNATPGLRGSSAVVAGTAGTAAAIGTGNLLPALGFCAAGVKAGSIAAGVQSVVYGAMVPAGGLFATLQSWGATGAMAGVFGVAALPVGAVVGIGTYLAMNRLGPADQGDDDDQVHAADQADDGNGGGGRGGDDDAEDREKTTNNSDHGDDDDDDDGMVGVSVEAEEKSRATA